MGRQGRPLYEFGSFRVDAANRLLLCNGQPVTLQPNTFETLLLLIERRGEVLEKGAIMRQVWPATHVEEANLTQNIYLLRKLFSRDAGGHEYIETVPKRGYRFAAPVRELTAQSTVSSSVRSLAVLPLRTITGDNTTEYLGVGMADALINKLSGLTLIDVRPTSAVLRFARAPVDAIQFGRELRVGLVLTGQIQTAGDRIRVSMQLIEVDENSLLWGAHFNEQLTDIFAVEDSISEQVARALSLRLSGAEQEHLTKRHTASAEAYQLYLKGRFAWNKRLTETVQSALGYFEEAVKIDPDYALAYVGLADCYPLLSLYGALTPQQAYPKAKAAAERALALDERLAEAHTSLAVVKLFYEWDWAGAETACRRAIEINPGYADAHQRYGIYLVTQERFAEAVAELDRARELDPLSLIISTISAYPHYYSRRYEQAVEIYRKTLEMDANFSMAHFRLGLTYSQMGKLAEAAVELERAKTLSGDRDATAALGYVHALMGKEAEAQQALEELTRRAQHEYVAAYNYAIIYTGLGKTDEALRWLEKAYEERSYWLIYSKVDPLLDRLRGVARFNELVATNHAAAEQDTP